MSPLRHARRAVAVATAFLFFCMPAVSQTLGTFFSTGSNPAAISVNHVTNKIYVANSDSDTVTVIDGAAGTTKTVAVGDRPFWIAVNVDTNTIYVANRNSANVTVLDGSTDTVAATLSSGGSGWMAVSPFIDASYAIRNGTTGEVSVIEGRTYELTSATRSVQPVALAVNPVTNRLYVAHATTGDIVALDMTSPQSFPPLLCPDGSGGFRPQPAPPPTPHTLPCIDVPGTPVAVAVNPVTNRVYAISDGVTNRISVIDGSNHTHVSLTPPGVTGAARAIAVDPIRNSIWAAFADALVHIAGSNNAVTVLPTGSGGGGPVGLALDLTTNTVYVPNADGTMRIQSATSGTSNTIGIPPGARAVAVNPLTHRVYVLVASGVQSVVGLAAAAPIPTLTAAITPLPGNTGAATGTIAITATSTMSSSPPLNQPRKVYFRIGTGPWTEAVGTGPYPAHYTVPGPGTYTLEAFATNGLDGPSINTDFATAPVVSNVVSYTFTVGTAEPNPARVANLSARGLVLTGDNRMIAGFVIGGAVTKRVAIVGTGPSLSAFGITNPLPNPRLTLVRASDQSTVTINDNWQSNPNASQLQAAGLAPANPLEAGVLIDLPPGAYTAILEDANAATGVGVVAVYEVDDPEVWLANLSTRGRVGAGNDLLIGGFVVDGESAQTVAVVATGPSLSGFGVPNVLADPVLTLVRSSDQQVIASNDNWTAASNASQLLNTGFAPPNINEAAILVTLPPGAYTAILSGSGGGTGVGIIAVYAVK